MNGAAYTPDVLKAAITANKGGQAPIKLLLKHDDRYREAVIDYRGGLRYPRAQKIGTGESGLDRLLSAK